MILTAILDLKFLFHSIIFKVFFAVCGAQRKVATQRIAANQEKSLTAVIEGIKESYLKDYDLSPADTTRLAIS